MIRNRSSLIARSLIARAVPYLMVSQDAKRALEEFSEAMRDALALGEFASWATDLGLHNQSRAIKTTYPIPISAAGYHEFKGDMKYRSLFKRSLSMTGKEWQDGVAELASIVEAPDFIGWSQEPANIAFEAQRAPNEWVMSILEANPNLDFYRDEETGTASAKALFASDHPINVLDDSVADPAGNTTFDNDHTAVEIGTAMWAGVLQRFAERPGPNGKRMNLQPTHLLVPPALVEPARDFFENDLLLEVMTEGVSGTRRNRYYKAVQIVVTPESTNDDLVYVISKSKPGLFPWIVQDEGAPEEIMHDKTDALYKSELKIGVSYILRGNAAACLPHCIERIQITG